MPKIVIVDDQQLGVDSLKWELARVAPEMEIVATFTKPLEALEYLKIQQIDLLFLDIQMPKMTGIELLEALGEIKFKVIFVTAFDEYALKAFKFSAIEYLLKPVDVEDLKVALNKFLQNLRSPIQKQLPVFTQAKEGNLPDKLVFATKQTYEFILPENILYCEAYSNYTTLYFKDGKLVISKTLKGVEAILVDYKFIRVHQSFLINPKHIKRYVKTDGGSVVMVDKKEIPVSRSRKEAFLAQIVKS